MSELVVVLAVRIHPKNRLYDPWRVGLSRKHGPPLAYFIPVLNHADVICQVPINSGLCILEAQLSAERVDLLGFAG